MARYYDGPTIRKSPAMRQARERVAAIWRPILPDVVALRQQSNQTASLRAEAGRLEMMGRADASYGSGRTVGTWQERANQQRDEADRLSAAVAILEVRIGDRTRAALADTSSTLATITASRSDLEPPAVRCYATMSHAERLAELDRHIRRWTPFEAYGTWIHEGLVPSEREELAEPATVAAVELTAAECERAAVAVADPAATVGVRVVDRGPAGTLRPVRAGQMGFAF